jgi:hypothetical protein
MDAAMDAALDDAMGDASVPPARGFSDACGHLQFTSAYYVESGAYGDYVAEASDVLQAGHVDSDRAFETPMRSILDLHWFVFDYTAHTVRADIAAQLDVIELLIAGRHDRVAALYLVDEPYQHGIPRSELERAITLVHARFPDVPTYMTFGAGCFDPSFDDASVDCTHLLLPSDRGLPAGLDWVGLDWYTSSSDLGVARTHVRDVIAPLVARLEVLGAEHIVIAPDAYTDAARTQDVLAVVIPSYLDLALRNPLVLGVDWFLWADVPSESFIGLHSLPRFRAIARAFAREVARNCGETPALVPIVQWRVTANGDYAYRAWHWLGGVELAELDGVAFALPPVGTPGTTTLYHCDVMVSSGRDSFLTTDDGCEGAAIDGVPTPYGGIFSAAVSGTVPLHRYVNSASDHLYTIAGPELVPSTYALERDVGFVYPPSAL